MTNFEALRVLMQNEKIASGEAPHTIEFHWYASRNGPLEGSGALFKDYFTRQNREVVAMLNQDRTGYTGDVPDGEIPALGLVADFTDKSLTEFVSLVIKEYTSNPFRYASCGGECSDHVSATDNGYPSAYVRASPDGRNENVNTPLDTIETLNLGNMIEHVKLVVGFVTELAFAELG
jgi:leucyl aminopeptidase